MNRHPVPDCTYRLQFNAEFTFRDAEALVPYLAALGVSHVYASPYLKARSGSPHGYDIVDHSALNPEIGSREDYDRFVDALHRHGLGQILDLVPNHMGVGGADNGWWLHVLEHGQASPYAEYFDIDWGPVKEELRNKVLVPVLDDHYGAVLERGGLQLRFAPEDGTFSVWFYEHRLPIDPRTYPGILGGADAHLAQDPILLSEWHALLGALDNLPNRDDPDPGQRARRLRQAAECQRRLAALYGESSMLREFLDRRVEELNGVPGEPASFDALHRLLEDQAYRPAWWRVAADEINYRRFFDINDLAALRMENSRVFDDTHRLVGELLAAGAVDGLRIDHPDGLYDPPAYLRHLRERLGGGDAEPFYLVVEKILAPYERLPEHWPVHGTTGYEFAYLTNNLLLDPSGEPSLTRTYHRFLGEPPGYEDLLYRCKLLIILGQLSSEITVLSNQADGIAQARRHTRDFTLNGLRDALVEAVANFPVYRTYVNESGPSDEDRRYVHWAMARAKKRNQAKDPLIFDFLQQLMLAEGCDGAPEPLRGAVRRFAVRMQQYTAPVLAKAMEDTAFYRYNRLVSLNEVGGEPEHFGISVAAFHHASRERRERWPHAMLSTSTHDTKRSEDVRARLAVLSELPGEWRRHLGRWSRINRAKAVRLDSGRAPSRNDEYLIYQTLLGVWPLEPPDGSALDALHGRVAAYMVKAMREAKARSSWLNPDEEYEQAVLNFLGSLLRARRNAFLTDFAPLAERIARIGLYNSLAQVALKLTAPGVPDIYQGNELWTFRLVDPDNREAVDYRHRAEQLDALRAQNEPPSGTWPAELLTNLADGRAKLYLTWKLLTFRRRHGALFRDGDYVPLNAEGDHADHVCAYTRGSNGERLLVVVPLRVAPFVGDAGEPPTGAAIWQGTWLQLPEDHAPYRWTDLLSGRRLPLAEAASPAILPLEMLLAGFPVAVLHGVRTPG